MHLAHNQANEFRAEMLKSSSMPAPVRVPFTDLSIQWSAIEAAVRPDLERIFETSEFILGPYVERFEQAIAAYLGAGHAIGVNSGTSALHLALIAAGIVPGDKVLVPAMTFVATVWPVLYIGAVPVLCDVDATTGNIDVADAERRIEPGVKAIVPVHLYGQPADMTMVCEFAARHRLAIVEDAAQAIGARFNGVPVGRIGELGCFSFYPAKNLGAAGEGGLIVTADGRTAERLRSLRHHAQKERHVHSELGFNYRMEGIQGLFLYHKLAHLDVWTAARRRIATRYLMGLANLPLDLPQIAHHDHVYHLFVVRTPERNALRVYLAERGIQTGLHYPVPIHRQPCFAKFDFDLNAYPISDKYANEGLSLPIYSGMSDKQTDLVIDEVRNFFDECEPAGRKSDL
jgi:dTDP-4-amino-4,6-dideoxygalactose transaminase